MISFFLITKFEAAAVTASSDAERWLNLAPRLSHECFFIPLSNTINPDEYLHVHQGGSCNLHHVAQTEIKLLFNQLMLMLCTYFWSHWKRLIELCAHLTNNMLWTALRFLQYSLDLVALAVQRPDQRDMDHSLFTCG